MLNKSCLIGRLAEINKNVKQEQCEKIKDSHLGYRLHGLILGASVPPSASSSSSSSWAAWKTTSVQVKCIPLGWTTEGDDIEWQSVPVADNGNTVISLSNGAIHSYSYPSLARHFVNQSDYWCGSSHLTDTAELTKSNERQCCANIHLRLKASSQILVDVHLILWQRPNRPENGVCWWLPYFKSYSLYHRHSSRSQFEHWLVHNWNGSSSRLNEEELHFFDRFVQAQVEREKDLLVITIRRRFDSRNNGGLSLWAPHLAHTSSKLKKNSRDTHITRKSIAIRSDPSDVHHHCHRLL